IQMSSIKVATGLGYMEVSAIYCPPRHKIEERHFTEILASCGQRFLVGGDWNARHWMWGDTYNSPRGRELVESISVSRAKILATGSPTRYPYVPNHTATCIDFALYHGILDSQINICQSWDLESDHLALIVNLLTNGTNVRPSPRLITSRTDLITFKHILNNSFQLNSTLDTKEDIENAVEILTENIHRAASASTPPDPDFRPISYVEQANAFGQHLEDRFTPHNFASIEQSRETHQSLDTPLQMSLPIKPIRI
ncbi:hypothetical protein KR215_009331, partial [Drosophila sulfurigaster]